MPSEFGGTLSLGGLGFTFVLADEDARANVNSLYHYGGAEKATAAIRDLSGAFVAVRLNPEVPAIGGQKMVQEMPVPAGAAETDEEEPGVGADFASDAFRSWGQVFDLTRAPGLRSGAPNLSCFGSPALNVRRASDDCVIETAAVVVAKGKARTIVEDYRRSRASEIDRIIDRHTPNRWHRLQLKRLLSESSVCYSLRIVSGSPGSKSGSLVGIRDSFAAITLDEEGAMRTREVEY